MTAPCQVSAQVDGGAAQVPLYREIDALGGVASSQWEQGYAQAIYDVLTILEKRGFSETHDPMLDALVKLNAAGRTAWHFQHSDSNAQLGFATALAEARRAIVKAGGAA